MQRNSLSQNMLIESKDLLSDMVFCDTNFNDMNLTEYNVSRSRFYNCNFKKVILTNSNLTEVKFFNCTFHNVDFNGSDLEKSVIEDCKLISCFLLGVNLKEAYFKNTVIVESDLSYSKITKAHCDNNTEIIRSNLNGVDFLNSNIISTAKIDFDTQFKGSYGHSLKFLNNYRLTNQQKQMIRLSQNQRIYSEFFEYYLTITSMDRLLIKDIIYHKILPILLNLFIEKITKQIEKERITNIKLLLLNSMIAEKIKDENKTIKRFKTILEEDKPDEEKWQSICQSAHELIKKKEKMDKKKLSFWNKKQKNIDAFELCEAILADKLNEFSEYQPISNCNIQ